jgi:holo-[acyl-carrier protein] synthase
MILGIGIDLLDVRRMERELQREGGGLRDRVFTSGEIAYCQGKGRPAQHFAARFAAKEAVFKALAVEQREGWRWRDVEIETDTDGRPRAILHGAPKERAEALGVEVILVTLSHTGELAAAYVILESERVNATERRSTHEQRP